MTLRRSSLRDRRWAASLAAGLIAATFSGPALASCPWIVQPSDVITGDLPDYEIMFNGRPDPNLTYYAFTVTDADLAWELSSGNGLNAVDGRTRPLAVIESTDRDRFRADPSSVMPLTVYLVVATASIPKLDAIAASFEPSRPIAVGLRMRGASDTSGPLPHRSLPGVELHYASHDPSGTQIGSGSTEYQLCAYQVLIR
ncbi:MAG: hypothetical protein R3F54_11775 [Alphaproteobacteria bacterium]